MLEVAYPFPELLLQGAANYFDRDCIVLFDEWATYAELEQRACRVARSLLALGVERGDGVGILSANCLHFMDVLFGASLIGAVPVLYNARFKAREIAHVTVDAEVRVIVTTDIIDEHTDYVDLLQHALPGLGEQIDPTNISLPSAPSLRAAALLGSAEAGGFVSTKDFYALGDRIDPGLVDARHAETVIDDIAVMFYTSGTTAMPKGCPLSHVVMQHAGIVGTAGRLGMQQGETMWGPLPMFHTAFTQPLSATLHLGGTFLSMTHFEPGAALRMIEQEGATAMFPAFPTITMALLNHPDYRSDTFAKVRSALNVGPPEVLRTMQDRMPNVTQVTAFGMTESGGSVAMCDPADSVEHRTENSGFALPGDEITIRNPDTGEVLDREVKGEITIRGRGVFAGYHNDPVKTAEAFDDDGWFGTGDLGSMDPDGRVTFHGRLKDMLKVGGENVAAVEVEGFLATHPAVNIAQVVGVPDQKYEEVPVAFVELLPGTTSTEQEIIDFCRGDIASFKVPRHVRFVEEWPMGATKILKYELRATILKELEATDPPAAPQH